MHCSMGCTLATWSQHHDQAVTNEPQATAASAHSMHQTVSTLNKRRACMFDAHFVPDAATEGQQQVGAKTVAGATNTAASRSFSCCPLRPCVQPSLGGP
jgi:hypothetical protein